MQTRFALVIMPWGLCKWDYKRGYMCSTPLLYSRPRKWRVWLPTLPPPQSSKSGWPPQLLSSPGFGLVPGQSDSPYLITMSLKTIPRVEYYTICNTLNCYLQALDFYIFQWFLGKSKSKNGSCFFGGKNPKRDHEYIKSGWILRIKSNADFWD